MNESYYAYVKRTEPPNSPRRKRLERLKELLQGCFTMILTVDGITAEVTLTKIQELAKESGMSVTDFIEAVNDKESE